MVFPSKSVKGRYFEQSGSRKSALQDFDRRALLPGYRLSKDGKWYLETRKNRSDKKGSRL